MPLNEAAFRAHRQEILVNSTVEPKDLPEHCYNIQSPINTIINFSRCLFKYRLSDTPQLYTASAESGNRQTF